MFAVILGAFGATRFPPSFNVFFLGVAAGVVLVAIGLVDVAITISGVELASLVVDVASVAVASVDEAEPRVVPVDVAVDVAVVDVLDCV